MGHAVKGADRNNRPPFVRPRSQRDQPRRFPWPASPRNAALTAALATSSTTATPHVLPVIGHLQLRQIKPSTIQGLMRTLELSDTHRRVILANASAIFGAAVDDDLIAKNPCKAGSVARPSVVRRKVVPWPAEQVSAMHDALPERYRLAVALGSGLGLRQGEVFGLSPAVFNFLTGTVNVQRRAARRDPSHCPRASLPRSTLTSPSSRRCA